MTPEEQLIKMQAEVDAALSNATLSLMGECMALRAIVNALIATHQDRPGLAAAFEIAQRSAVQDWTNVPPPELTRFRAEQVMDRFAKEIDDHGDART